MSLTSHKIFILYCIVIIPVIVVLAIIVIIIILIVLLVVYWKRREDKGSSLTNSVTLQGNTVYYVCNDLIILLGVTSNTKVLDRKLMYTL